jgi:hypothetical protein
MMVAGVVAKLLRRGAVGIWKQSADPYQPTGPGSAELRWRLGVTISPASSVRWRKTAMRRILSVARLDTRPV